MHPEQTVAEMVTDVLERKTEALADRTGKPIEDAMEIVLNSEAGTQLRELRDGPHAQDGVQQWQVDIARERVQERVEQLGDHLEETLEHPTRG